MQANGWDMEHFGIYDIHSWRPFPGYTFAEWFKRWPAKPMGSPSADLNPTDIIILCVATVCRMSSFYDGAKQRAKILFCVQLRMCIVTLHNQLQNITASQFETQSLLKKNVLKNAT